METDRLSTGMMARGVPIWPDLKNLAIKWPGWKH